MKKILKYGLITILIFGFILMFINYTTKYTEHKYPLEEVYDGCYAIYYTTYSRVPSENYEVIRLCYNNSVYTLDGNVSITYTDEEPYVYIKDTNIIHEDEICVYLPKGSVKFEESVNISR